MGFNSTIMICNDALDSIAKDPEFGKNLADAILGLGIRSGDVAARTERCTHIGAAQVIETHHADGIAIVAVGGNCGQQIGFSYGVHNDGSPTNNELMLRDLADSMGYTIRKKTVKKH